MVQDPQFEKHGEILFSDPVPKSNPQNDVLEISRSTNHHEDDAADKIHYSDSDLELYHNSQQESAPTGQYGEASQDETPDMANTIVPALGKVSKHSGSHSEEQESISSSPPHNTQTFQEIRNNNNNFKPPDEPLPSNCPLESPPGSTFDGKDPQPTAVPPQVHRNPRGFRHEQSKDLPQLKPLSEVHRDPRVSLQQNKHSGDSKKPIKRTTTGRKQRSHQNAAKQFVPPRRVETRRSAAAKASQ